jgi:hypothetical protein
VAVYKANYNYKLAFFFGILLSLISFIIGSLLLIIGYKSAFLIIFIPSIIFLTVFLFIVPKSIVVEKEGIIFKTAIRNKNIEYSEIKEIKKYYSTKSLFWFSGDKEKADIICIMRLKNNPLNLLYFGDAISNYKELYKKLLKTIENKSC